VVKYKIDAIKNGGAAPAKKAAKKAS
jgi:hypothetical protein